MYNNTESAAEGMLKGIKEKEKPYRIAFISILICSIMFFSLSILSIIISRRKHKYE